MVILKKARPNLPTRWLNAKPARVISASFMLVITVGTVLLMMPFAASSGHSVGLLRALFTATSATCVTGLVVLDTATGWTLFGQVVILALIQIGGLGLVTITSFFYSLMRRKTSLKTLVVTAESTASFGFADVLRLVRQVVVITFSIELVGALLLSWRYVGYFGWKQGLYKGFFQAVSAFCNAGFDVLGDTASGPCSSLVAFNGDPVVLMTTGLLIILGGLGFVVWSDLLALPRKRKLEFHSRLVLTMTGILIGIGFVLYYVIERQNTGSTYALGSLPTWQQPLAALFQSVTTRTAGFNSIDQATLSDSSKFLTTILMFIGAAPGSTAGGIKITTFTVIIATVISDIRGEDNPLLFRHRLARETFTRALAIFGLAFSIVVVGVMSLSAIEQSALQTGRFSFLDLLFEATSAFGTVGLSSVGTPTLQPLSWLFLIPAMYLGRVGPASFAIGLAMRKLRHTERIRPEGKTMIG